MSRHARNDDTACRWPSSSRTVMAIITAIAREPKGIGIPLVDAAPPLPLCHQTHKFYHGKKL